MIEKMFGSTEDEQLRYLGPRLKALGGAALFFAAGLLIAAFGRLLDLQMLLSLAGGLWFIAEAIFVITLLVFGWALMRSLFGFATVGALLANNIVVGVVILVVYLMIGYLGGLIVAVIGLCRYLRLMKIRKA